VPPIASKVLEKINLGQRTEAPHEYAACSSTIVQSSANPTDAHSHFVVEQGKNVVGQGTINDHFENHGHVLGNGTAEVQRQDLAAVTKARSTTQERYLY